MSVPTKYYDFVDGQTPAGKVTAARLNGNLDPLFACLNPAIGGLEDDNVKTGAKILVSDRNYTGSAKITGSYEFSAFPTIPDVSIPNAKLQSSVMLKTTYDTDADGKVNDADKLDGVEGSGYAVAASGVTNGDSHDHIGGDGAAIAEGALSLSDVVTGDVSSSKHGFCPKLDVSTAHFLRGDGAWAEAGVGMDSRRWAAGRASGAAWLNVLLDTTYTGAFTYPAAEPNYVRLATAATANTTSAWVSQNSSWLTSKTGRFDVTFRVYFESLANAKAWVGLTDSTWNDLSEDPSGKHLAIFRYSSVAGSNIRAVVKDGTTINAVDTGVAAAASWFTLRIVAVSDSQIDFYINGTKTNGLTTNLPTSQMLLFVMVATSEAVVKYLRLGAFSGSFNG
jgi:hypothetical protein